MRSSSRPLLAALVALALGAGCPLYTPTLRDCSVSCGDGGACPSGTSCNEGICRPDGFTGACDCTPDDVQVCGGGRGECRAGQRTCLDTRTWGPCLGEVRARSEICDGKDNDCDGFTDEETIDAPSCPLSKGVCGLTAQRCIDGGYIDTCGPTTYGASYEVSEQTCDGLDNDCDGVVDARSPLRLATDVNAWTVEAIDTGFLLFTTVAGATGITAQALDGQLAPVGSPLTLPTAQEVSSFRTRAAAGNTVAVGYRYANGNFGIARVSGGAVTTLTTGVSLTTSSWALAVQPGGTVLGAFERDGGLELRRWAPSDSVSTLVPWGPRSPVTTVDAVTLSRQGEVLAWDGEYDPMDGGSTETVGGVELLDGGRATSETGLAYSEVVVTPTRVQAVYDFSTYLPFAFPLSFNESGVRVCFDALQDPVAWTNIARVQDYMQIRGASGVRLQAEMLVGWLDASALNLGTALPSVGQVRSRLVSVPGGAGTVADYALAAQPGSGLVGVFYRSQAEPLSVQGTLMCPP